MGLFQNLLETYDKCSYIIGIAATDSDGNSSDKKMLLPIFHMTFKSAICVEIDGQGKFISAERDDKETTIVIPCTENSGGRSSGIAAHPLCDQIDYVGGISDEKTSAYLTGLGEWKDNIPELNAIYNYVSSQTLISDISSLFKDNEYDKDKGKIINEDKVRKLGVRFIVRNNGERVKVWESVDLQNAWIDFINKNAAADSSVFDYISGENVSAIATQHPKNINSMTGNAKLLSCNEQKQDSDCYIVFKGRFTTQNDAVITDYAQSSKMHQMLRWLIANYGYAVDTQVVVTWAVDKDTEVKAKPQDDSFDLFGDMETTKTSADLILEAKTQVYGDYAAKLNNLLRGMGKADSLKKHARKICIAVFDAATTGRMGLVFYRELAENEYLESIADWHNDTSYYLSSWKKDGKDEKGKDKKTLIHYIGAPSYDDIIFAVYGKGRGDKGYDTLKKKIRKQLLECMFGSFNFPKSMVEMAASRVSNPMSFDVDWKKEENKSFYNENDWTRAIGISCALVRKYFKQQKEEIALELDTKRTDRDYLFGRLLSVADRLESKALYKAEVKRPTNAVKLMSAFQFKPFSTWGLIFNQLIPYKTQLNGAWYYQNVIDEIMTLFQNNDFENNAPLSPLYLLGYSAQNRAFMKHNDNENTEGTDYVNTEE